MSTELEKPETLLPMVAWAKKGSLWGLTVIDDPAIKKLRRKELSPSMSFALDGCPASMAGDRLLPRDEAPFQANSLGTAAHAVMEILYALAQEERTKEKACEIVRMLGTDRELADDALGNPLAPMIFALDESEHARWVAEVERRALGVWEIEDPMTVEVFANEMAVGGWDFKNQRPFEHKATINGVPVIARIDRTDVIRDADGEIIGYAVVDYKMGKYKEPDPRYGDDYGDQIRLYRDSVHQVTGLPITTGRLYFNTYGKFREIDLSEDKMELTRARYKRAFDKMNRMADENHWPVKAGPLCSWCSLVNSCPVAVAAGKKDLSNTEKVNGQRVVSKNPDGTPVAPKAYTSVQLGIRTVSTIKVLVEDAPRAAKKAPAKPTVPDVIVVQEKVAGSAAKPTKTAKPAKTVEPALDTAEVAEKPKTKKKNSSSKEVAHLATAAAHRSSEQANREETTMATPALLKEGNSVRDSTVDGELNPNSYAAMAVFGITQLAVEALAKEGKKLTPKTVKALTYTFATVIERGQRRLTGQFNWADGANTRLRGALRTCVETMPLPWGEGAAQWESWVESAVNRCHAISVVSVGLFDLDELPTEPWTDLAA